MYDFTKRKFLALRHERQHRKCAELLHDLYAKLIHHQRIDLEWAYYQEFLLWMSEVPPSDLSIQGVADRYHIHLQKAGLAKKEHHLLPQVRKGDRQEAEEPWPIAIYLDHIRSAHNVGSIIRTTEALSFGNIYFSSQTPFITHKQVQDTAMGANEWVNCFQGVELASLPKPIIVMETSPEALSIYDFDFPTTFTLVVGNEEYGCSDNALKLADTIVEIPLRGRKNSLNVANAFAIAAGEISRQRKLD